MITFDPLPSSLIGSPISHNLPTISAKLFGVSGDQQRIRRPAHIHGGVICHVDVLLQAAAEIQFVVHSARVRRS